MNTQRLKALEAVLREEAEHFDLKVLYLDQNLNGLNDVVCMQTKPACGYVACIVGHAILSSNAQPLPGKQMDWFLSYYGLTSDEWAVRAWCYYGTPSSAALDRWCKYPQHVTASDAADLINYIWVNRKVPEDWKVIERYKEGRSL